MILKKCFVIAPIGEDHSEERKRVNTIIKEVLEPVLEGTCEVFAAHQIKKPGIITSQIVEMIFEADLIIADLTNVNGNVMYELAIAHLKEKQVIIIANKGTKLPFDVSHNRVIFYEDNIHGSFNLKREIEDVIKNINFETASENPISITLNKNKTTLISEETIKNTIKEAVYDNFIKRTPKNRNQQNLMDNVVEKLNNPQTDKQIISYIKSEKGFNAKKFYDSVCNSIETKKFPIEILKIEKSISIDSGVNRITFDYILTSKDKTFLVIISPTIFRISLQGIGIKLVKTFPVILGYNKPQPLIIVPTEMPNAGKLIVKKIPLLKYNSLTNEFVNWEIIEKDFDKINNDT